MTERLSPMDRKLVLHSAVAPIAAANMAAIAVAGELGMRKHNPALWPALGAGEDCDALALVIDTLAPFVRANPGVPAEALFIHAQVAGVHSAGLSSWAIQPAWVRLAYSTFQSTLSAVDIEIQRAIAALPTPASKFAVLDPEGTLLEETSGFLDRVDFGPDPNAKKGRK